MWPFKRSLTAPDDLRRLEAVEEKVESVLRRMTSLMEDVDEYFTKINKARQRVVKEERDALKAGSVVAAEAGPVDRAVLKAQIRQRLTRGGA